MALVAIKQHQIPLQRVAVLRQIAGDKLRSKGTQDIPAGEHLIVHAPDGAGYGDPAKRDPAAFARDIRDGLVSESQAAAVYRA